MPILLPERMGRTSMGIVHIPVLFSVKGLVEQSISLNDPLKHLLQGNVVPEWTVGYEQYLEKYIRLETKNELGLAIILDIIQLCLYSFDDLLLESDRKDKEADWWCWRHIW